MSTEFICKVGPGQADYSSLADFITALPSDLTTAKVFSHSGPTGTLADGDTVTGETSGATATVVHNTSSQIYLTGISGTFQSGEKVYKDSGNYVIISDAGDIAHAVAEVGTTGTADTAAVNIESITTSSSAKIKIRPQSWHPGKWSTSHYRLEVAAYKVIDVNVDYIEIRGLQIYGTNAGNTYGIYIAGQNASNEILIDRCIIRFNDNNNSSYWRRGVRSYDSDIVLKIKNTIIYDAKNSTNNACAGIYWDLGTSAYVYNCTIFNCYFGIYSNNSSIIVKNTVTNSCSNGFYGSFDSSSDYNASDISSDAPGANSRNGTDGDATFRDEANDDFHLAASDTALRGYGTDLTSDSSLAVTEDIDGDDITIANSFNIGADQDVAAQGNVTLPQFDVSGSCYLPQTFETSGDVDLPQFDVDGDFEILRLRSANAEISLPIFSIETESSWSRVSVAMEYETWPLDPEFPWAEIYQYEVIQSPEEYGVIKRRARQPRARRAWRFLQELATPEEAEVFRAFVRDHVGGAYPFYVTIPGSVARPWKAPTLTVTKGGSVSSQRTLYVGYTWRGASGETQICYNVDSIAVPAYYRLVVSVPTFPENVTGAGIYVGTSENDLHYQDTVTNSGGSWTEPAYGYSSSGSAPPTENTLSETVLVALEEKSTTVTKKSAASFRLEATFIELFPETQKAVYGAWHVSLPQFSVSASAKVSLFRVSGDVDLPQFSVSATGKLPTVRGSISLPQFSVDAQTTSPWGVAGNVDFPQFSISASSSLVEIGDWYVSPSGDDSGTGSSSDPFKTIQHAVNVAQSGDTIVVMSGTYNESIALQRSDITIIGQSGAHIVATGDHGINGEYVSNITINGLEISGASLRGIRCYRGDSWTIKNCTIHDCEERGIHLVGQNDGWSYYHGAGHLVERNIIYNIYHNSEAMGIYLSRCTDCEVRENVIYLCRKEGIRTIRSKNITAHHNKIFRCWNAMAFESDSSAINYHDNYIYECDYGTYVKHVNGDIGWNYFEHNTVINCGIAVRITNQTPAATYIKTRYNLLEGAYHLFLLMDTSESNIVVDSNMYHNTNSVWHYYSSNDSYTNSTFYDSLEEIRSNTSYEGNGVYYDSSTASDYGADSVVDLTDAAFTSYSATAINASSGTSTMARVCDHGYLSVWKSSSDSNEYVIIDLGQSRTITHIFLLPWAHDAPYSNYNPKNVTLKVSSDNVSYSTVASRTNDSKGATHIYPLSAATNCRYIRLDVADSQVAGYNIWVADLFCGQLT